MTFPNLYPDAKQIPSFHQSRGNDAIRTCSINHVMAGRLRYLDEMARAKDGLDGGRKVSVHFGLNEDGEVHQFVKLHNWAWGAGRVTTADKTIRALFGVDGRGDVNGNIGSVQVEHPGTSIPLDYAPSLRPWNTTDNRLPQALIDASIKLQMWLVENGVVRPVFIGHGDSDPKSRPHDPGDCIRNEIMQPLKEWAATRNQAPMAATESPAAATVADPAPTANADALAALERGYSDHEVRIKELERKARNASEAWD